MGDSYNHHVVFDELDYILKIYDSISLTSFPFVAVGVEHIMNFESYIFESMSGTLESMSILLRNGRINDSFSLLRTFYDDVLYSIYFELTEHQFAKQCVDAMDFCKRNNDIEDWLSSKKSMPSISQIRKYLISSAETSELFLLFNDKLVPKEYRSFLDDSVHRNKFVRVLLNCNKCYLKEREGYLESFKMIVKALFTLHLSFLFLLSPAYVMSSEYMDSLDFGITPSIDASRLVAPFAQEAFDKYIKPHKAVSDYLKAHAQLDID